MFWKSKKNKNKKENKIEIVPTVMPTSYEDFVEKINRVAPFVKTIQIDVMDGKFVPSTSWPYNSAPNSEDEKKWQNLVNQDDGLPHWQDINFEIDLMVEDQITEARNWISAGVMRVICHIEALKEGERDDFLGLKKDFGIELSLALIPETPNSVLDEYLDIVDSIQFMGINKIGFQGQEFEPKVLEKIAELYAKKPGLQISIDGGVSFKTARELVDAGATRLASGSLIFKAENTEEAIKNLRKTSTSN